MTVAMLVTIIKLIIINNTSWIRVWNQEVDHIILHTGNNDLSSDETPVEICNDIVNLAASIKDKDIKVRIPEIVEWNDAWKSCIGKWISVKNMLNYWATNNQTSQYQSRFSFKAK